MDEALGCFAGGTMNDVMRCGKAVLSVRERVIFVQYFC